MARRMRVLISGGGIAGISLAFWLARLDHEVTVVERFPELRVNGLQIDLRGHGIEVLKRMGLDEAFRAKAAPEMGLQIVDSAGKRWAYFGANKSGDGTQSFTSDYEIMRSDFCRLIYEPAKDKVKYIFGTTIETFDDKGSHVAVRFSDGQTGSYDLLVGADGAASRTRKLLLGPDTADPFHAVSQCIAYFTLPWKAKPGEDTTATVYFTPKGQTVLTRRHDPNILQVYLIASSVREPLKAVRRGDVEGEKEVFANAFRGAGWQLDTILAAMKENTDFYCERQGVIRMDAWSQGRVALLGDAAFCLTAGPGMGTSAALIGAYIMAGEIAKHYGRGHDEKESNGIGGGEDELKDRLLTALKSYEDIYRPHMLAAQEGIDEPGIMDKIPWNRITVYILYWLVWFAGMVRLDLLLARFMRDKFSSWKLPDYKELLDAQ